MEKDPESVPEQEITSSDAGSSGGSPEALLLDDEAGADEPARQQGQDHAFDVVRGEAHVCPRHCPAPLCLFFLALLMGKLLKTMASRGSSVS